MRTKTLEGWLRGIRLSHIAQSRAASRNLRMHRVLGIPVVILTTFVGTAVFASVGKTPQHPAVPIVTGVLSVLAAILSSLQTFLGHSSNAERHKSAAVKYGMLRRELEQFLEDSDESSQILKEFMENFRARWDQVDQESLVVSEKIHDEAVRILERNLAEEKLREAQ